MIPKNQYCSVLKPAQQAECGKAFDQAYASACGNAPTSQTAECETIFNEVVDSLSVDCSNDRSNSSQRSKSACVYSNLNPAYKNKRTFVVPRWSAEGPKYFTDHMASIGPTLEVAHEKQRGNKVDLQAAFECIRRVNEKEKINCLKKSNVLLPKNEGDCVIANDYKLYRSWYDFDYSSQYVKLMICKTGPTNFNAQASYLRAPLVAGAGWIAAGLIQKACTQFFLKTVGVTATGFALGAVVSAFGSGWCVGKLIDEGVGIFTDNKKLSDIIGDWMAS